MSALFFLQKCFTAGRLQPERSGLTSWNVFRLRRQSKFLVHARTVLAAKGSLRLAVRALPSVLRSGVKAMRGRPGRAD